MGKTSQLRYGSLLGAASHMGSHAWDKFKKYGFSGKTKAASKGGRAVKRRVKNKRSYTKTKTKKERFSGDDTHAGTGATVAYVHVNRYVKNMQRRSGHIRYVYDYPVMNQAVAGKQSATVALSLGTCQQWLNDTADPNSDQSVKNWFSLNPSSWTTGSSYYQTLTPKVDRLVLHKAMVDMYFTNFENIEQDVTVFVFKAKRHLKEGVVTLWNNSLYYDNNNTSTLTYPAAGSNVAGTAGLATADLPRTSPRGGEFYSQYKLLKVKKVRLAAAGSHNMKFFVTMNMLGKKELFTDLLGNNEYFPAGSIQFLVICNGQVVHDLTSTPAPNVLTFGTVKVGLISKVHLSFKPYENGPSRINAEVDVTKIPAGALIGNEYINNAVDAVSAVVQA